MKKLFLIFLFFIYSILGFSQFIDNFSDGDFTNNPSWTGSLNNFEIDTAFRLHLNDTISNTSYLSTLSNSILNGIWEFDVKLDFEPSTSNYAKVYLTSNKEDLTGGLNGYFVKIGGESNAVDDISLYSQNNLSTTKIIDGTNGLAALNPEIKIRVLRDALGNWELLVDTSGGYFSEGIVFDTSSVSSDYFGVFCKYTSTRAKKMWFDNFNVSGGFLVDTVSPTIISASINSTNSVLIEFSEAIDTNTAQNTNNYFITNGIGAPNLAALVNEKSIEIFFSTPFVSPSSYVLSVININDLNENTMSVFDTTIVYFLIKENDIIINEIFADPTPSIGLPEYEYLELYNSTSSTIDLTNWTITIGSTNKIFPQSSIEPNNFVILTKEDAYSLFPSNISKIGFSSISLTNSGSDIILKNNTGKTIATVSYTDKWYNNDDKANGGWSLERINPNLFCEGGNNWTASKATIGGSPGVENSVFGEPVPIPDFRITKALILDSNTVEVHFNKALDSLMLLDLSWFEVSGSNPISSIPISTFFNSVSLIFDFTFSTNISYTLSANELSDCSGKFISNFITFGIPDTVLENNIIINEVLFNPKDNGVDYIELFNNSDSYFDLSKLRTANFFNFGLQNYAENAKIITEDATLFPPKSYLVLTSDSAKVKAQYLCENPYNFILVESLPTLPNDDGTICIVHQSLNQIIDAFSYNEEMHFPLLENTDGVSLERLDKNAKTQNTDNWHSAASTVGFGTPTYKNSQEFIPQSIGQIAVEPKLFTPNNDGSKDVCSISWNFNKNNLMSTIKIFDSKGRFVTNLLENELIGNSGSLVWNGLSENNLELNSGIYIIWMEVFSTEGDIEQFKDVVVLSK